MKPAAQTVHADTDTLPAAAVMRPEGQAVQTASPAAEKPVMQSCAIEPWPPGQNQPASGLPPAGEQICGAKATPLYSKKGGADLMMAAVNVKVIEAIEYRVFSEVKNIFVSSGDNAMPLSAQGVEPVPPKTQPHGGTPIFGSTLDGTG